MTNLPNGRLEADVTVNFTDGFAYSKRRMEEAFRSGIFDRPPPKAHKEIFNVRKEDVDIIVNELEIPRQQAEKALAATGGDLLKTLQMLVSVE